MLSLKRTFSKSHHFKEGVYYSDNAYAGLTRRSLAGVIDLLALSLASAAIIIIFFELPEDPRRLFSSKSYIFIFCSYFYLVFVKRSSWGTIGYWMTGIRIITLDGRCPSLWDMTFRFTFLLLGYPLGPFYILLDTYLFYDDKYKQTLRDKMAGTYVIREDAHPIGAGEQVLATYFLLNLIILLPEVRRPAT